jgi:hypothetical protein
MAWVGATEYQIMANQDWKLLAQMAAFRYNPDYSTLSQVATIWNDPANKGLKNYDRFGRVAEGLAKAWPEKYSGGAAEGLIHIFAPEIKNYLEGKDRITAEKHLGAFPDSQRVRELLEDLHYTATINPEFKSSLDATFGPKTGIRVDWTAKQIIDSVPNNKQFKLVQGMGFV